MATPVVEMDPDKVIDMAKKFQQISAVLNKVSKTLEMLANTLKATAFMGMVGGVAVLHVIEKIRPRIKDLAQKCAEVSKDLKTSAEAFRRGDMAGANLFATKYGGM